MADPLAAIDGHREAILLGEIGALLHMFGKCSREFLLANSIEGGAPDSHQHLKHLPALAPRLQHGAIRDAFAFTLDGHRHVLVDDFTDFITKYKGDKPDCLLLRLFNTCHRMTSADEKGVVRKKQPKDDMWIATPFGHPARKIEVDDAEARRDTMDRQLAAAFDSYDSKQGTIEALRREAIRILEPGLSQALGDTRRPANDVTLWAQSHGVAGLYKPVLATLAMGLNPCPTKSGMPDYNDVRWRLLGIGWNGRGFMQRGRKPGDILKRQEILNDIATAIQEQIEVTHPVGNRFYADLNGLFFTFPGLGDDDARELAAELAPELIEIVRGRSSNELWPFFTLSKPRRTLTVVTNEIEALSKIAAAPKVAALLSMEQAQGERQEYLLASGPRLPLPPHGHDVCPICQLRDKVPQDDTCPTCADRRSNRQTTWHQNRQDQTIWVDEVADESSRIALMTCGSLKSQGGWPPMAVRRE